MLVRFFAEFQDLLPNSRISKKAVERVLDALYSKGMSMDQLQWAVSNLRCMKYDQMMNGLVENASDEEVQGVVDAIYDSITEQKESSVPDRAYSLNTEITAWMFEEIKKQKKDFKEGDMVEIQVMRVGKWKHPNYGEVKVTEKTLENVQKNFEENKRGIELAVDENHEDDHKALGWIRKVFRQGKDALFASIELTKKGAQLLTDGAYKYFSPEIIFSKKDEETGENVKDLLVGGAFTNRPFFKAMVPLMASEEAAGRRTNVSDKQTVSSPIIFNNLIKPMRKFLEMLSEIAGKEKLSATDIGHLKYSFNELKEENQKDVGDAVEDIYNRFEEENKKKVADVEPVKPEVQAGGEDQGGKRKEDAGADDMGQKKDDDKVETPEEKKAAEDAAAADQAKADEEAAASAAAEEAAKAEEKKVEANEKGEVTIKASELETLKGAQKTLSKMIKDQKEKAIGERVGKLVFNEATKSGVVLPKSKERITKFCASLSDVQANEFLTILEGQNKDRSILFTEIGNGSGSPEKTAELDDAKKYFMDQGETEEVALESAKNFVAIKKDKGASL